MMVEMRLKDALKTYCERKSPQVKWEKISCKKKRKK
jgi:hypothetical protein